MKTSDSAQILTCCRLGPQWIGLLSIQVIKVIAVFHKLTPYLETWVAMTLPQDTLEQLLPLQARNTSRHSDLDVQSLIFHLVKRALFQNIHYDPKYCLNLPPKDATVKAGVTGAILMRLSFRRREFNNFLKARG